MGEYKEINKLLDAAYAKTPADIDDGYEEYIEILEEKSGRETRGIYDLIQLHMTIESGGLGQAFDRGQYDQLEGAIWFLDYVSSNEYAPLFGGVVNRILDIFNTAKDIEEDFQRGDADEAYQMEYLSRLEALDDEYRSICNFMLVRLEKFALVKNSIE